MSTFEVGFNWWMPVAVIEVIVMLLIGYANAKLVKRDNEYCIKTFCNRRLYKVLSTVFSVVFAVMVFIESSAGVVQYFDNLNNVEGNDLAWSLAEAPFAIMGASFIFGCFLYFVAVFSERSRKGKLYEKINERDIIDIELNDEDFEDVLCEYAQ